MPKKFEMIIIAIEHFFNQPYLSDFVSSWFFTNWASERLSSWDMTIKIPLKWFIINISVDKINVAAYL